MIYYSHRRGDYAIFITVIFFVPIYVYIYIYTYIYQNVSFVSAVSTYHVTKDQIAPEDISNE